MPLFRDDEDVDDATDDHGHLLEDFPNRQMQKLM
jgi:hypothetical protein